MARSRLGVAVLFAPASAFLSLRTRLMSSGTTSIISSSTTDLTGATAASAGMGRMDCRSVFKSLTANRRICTASDISRVGLIHMPVKPRSAATVQLAVPMTAAALADPKQPGAGGKRQIRTVPHPPGR